MGFAFEPKWYAREPAETFWLRDDTVVYGNSASARKAADAFCRRLKVLLEREWVPTRVRPKQTKNVILFRQGTPRRFLRKLKPGPQALLPAGEAGSPGAESFRVEVNHERIVVEAATAAGFRYGSAALGDMFDLHSTFFTGGTFEDEPAHPFRAMLLSLAHQYKAPRLGEKRVEIPPFDDFTADLIVERIARMRFNAVVIDVENAVRYRRLPQIARGHSQPMSVLRDLVRKAKAYGLEVIPKTNFSKSEKYRHNDWFEPYHRLPDGPEYWRLAGKVMDELIEVIRPRYYHIGMDEDHRPTTEYVAAVKALRDHLSARDVTPIMWLDIDKPYQPEVESKMREALDLLPRENLILTHWQYHGRSFNAAGEIRRRGFVTLGATWKDADATRAFALRGRELGLAGMIGTVWHQLTAAQRKTYADIIDVSGKSFWTGG